MKILIILFKCAVVAAQFMQIVAVDNNKLMHVHVHVQACMRRMGKCVS